MPEKYTRKTNTRCQTCGKAIYRRPGQIQQNKGRVFCGKFCYGKATRKEIPCLICNTPILSGLNKKTCSRKCANIHRTGISYLQNAPRDVVRSLRMIKERLIKKRGSSCERCGYNRYPIVQVHHKNRDRNDNSLKNLELLCPNCHCEEHLLKRR